jgi:hypothetical protein
MTAVGAGAQGGNIAGGVKVLKLRGGGWNVIFAGGSDFCGVGLDLVAAIACP